MAKSNKKWIVLCSTAVTAVYVAGYISTENVTTASTVTPYVQQNNGAITSMKPKNNEHKALKIDTSQAETSKNNATPVDSKYKDGTFTGTGSNRRGFIQVFVTVNNDKITDVEISHWGMHYSESDVADLPNEVVQLQNADVSNVSGATYSTEAFKDAIQDALYQSQQANG